MATFLLVVLILICFAMVATILLQRSEGGSLGIGGGGGGGMGGFMSGRGAGNALTRATAFLAAGFFLVTIAISFVQGLDGSGGSLIDDDSHEIEMLRPLTPEPEPENAPDAPAIPSAPTPE